MDVFWVMSSKASHSMDRSQVIGELNHAYVNGPVSVKSLHCAQYCVCFKENYSKYHRISFIKPKNEVSQCLYTFLNEVLTAGRRVKMLQCDGVKEFHVTKFVLSSVIVVLRCWCWCLMCPNKMELQNMKTIWL
jgi:hypothetical protein